MWDFSKYISKVLALNGCFWDSSYSLSQVWILFKNTFINYVKRLLVRRKIKRKIRASKKIGASLLPMLDFLARP